MRRVSIEDDYRDSGRWFGGWVVGGHRPWWPGSECNKRKSQQRLCSRVEVPVPNRIEHLLPFVGAENDDVVALGNIGEKTVGGDEDTKAIVALGNSPKLVDAVVDRGEVGIVFAERCRGDGEINAVEAKLANGSLGQVHMGDRGWIKRAGIDRPANR